MATEFELDQPPSDGISAVRFTPAPANTLLVASWDRVRAQGLQAYISRLIR